MIKTKLGEKALRHPQVNLNWLNVGWNRKVIHQTPVKEFADYLRFDIACYLAAVPDRNKFGFRPAMGDECNGYDEFIKEHYDEIEEKVRDIVNATYGQEGLEELV